MRVLIASLLLVLNASLALAKGTAVDADQQTVPVTLQFNGTEVLIFGALKPDNETTGALLTIKGPPINATLRRKARTLGLWLNVEQEELLDVPSYFQAFATEGLMSSAAEILFQDPLTDQSSVLDIARQPLTKWQAAFLETGQDRRLLRSDIGPLEVKDQLLFKARVDLPSYVVPGNYEISIYQLASDRIVSVSQQSLVVQRQGLNARFFDLANNQAALYGLICVLLAIACGYGAAYAFRK